MRDEKRPLRVIHLPTSVGGNPQGISVHLNRRGGYDSETWTMRQSPFGYSADRVLAGADDGFLRRQLKRLLALRYTLTADVAFFNFGTSLFAPLAIGAARSPGLTGLLELTFSWYCRGMRRLEFAVLRARRVVTLIQYQGDDARQGDVSEAAGGISIAAAMRGTGYYTPATDSVKRVNIAWYTARCDRVYALNPDLLPLLATDAEFLPYAHVPVHELVPAYPEAASRPLKIGHAPSHRGVKGTALVLAAVERLRTEGHAIELVLIEGLSHAEAMQRYREVDVVVDQLFAGWYGGVAVECMAQGKPVVCYLRESDLMRIPEQMRAELPIIRANPATIETVLRALVAMPRDELRGVAQRSRAFVERWHDPDRIAARIDADIQAILAARAGA